MVQEASSFEAEDKLHMEKVEAKNGFESYVYNVRNSLNDEKTREKLGASECDTYLEKTKVYLDWLDANQSATKDEYEEQKKASEAEFQPFFMKLYASDKDATSEDVPSYEQGPKIEEVD